jgi:molybdate transport system substrate-binding protein
LAVVGLVVGIVACGDDDDASSDTTSADTTAASSDSTAAIEEGDVTVFAAASLTESFTEIGDAFMAANPDTTVAFNFGSSSDLVAQINEGAPADVYASADQANMTKLTDAGNNGGDPQVFAKNSLEIIVESGNPQGIEGVADLENPDLIVVACDPEVPIGAYSQEVFEHAGVTVEPDSLEEDVKAVVNKVVIGEADAGVVYSTDVNAAGDDAEGVEISADINVTPEYPVAVTKEAENPDAATAFADFVVGDEGQSILASYGFSAP